MNKLHGPPTPGPVVRVVGRGLSLAIRVNDEDDAVIVRLALEMAQRRRWSIERYPQPALAPQAPR